MLKIGVTDVSQHSALYLSGLHSSCDTCDTKISTSPIGKIFWKIFLYSVIKNLCHRCHRCHSPLQTL